MTVVEIERRLTDLISIYRSRESDITALTGDAASAVRDAFEAGAGRSLAVGLVKLIREIDIATDKAAFDARERNEFPGRYDPPADAIPQGHPEDDRDYADNVGYW